MKKILFVFIFLSVNSIAKCQLADTTTEFTYIITQIMPSGTVVAHFTEYYEIEECCVRFVSANDEGELDTRVCGNYMIENVTGIHLLIKEFKKSKEDETLTVRPVPK